VRSETGRQMRETRAAADRLRAEAWAAARAAGEDGRARARVWNDYFREVERLHVESQQRVLARLTDAGEQLNRLTAGEDWATVVGRPMRDAVEDGLAELRSALADVETRKARWARLGVADLGEFEKRLDVQRLGVDVAEAEAWRLTAINPSRDGLDIVTGTQEAVDGMARAAASQVARARMQMTGKIKPHIGVDDYHEIADEVWGRFFKDAGRRWDLARAELAELPLSVEGQRRALRGLGWPDQAAGGLRPEQVQAVLGGGVRWELSPRTWG
jgi:hypothetical protein